MSEKLFNLPTGSGAAAMTPSETNTVASTETPAAVVAAPAVQDDTVTAPSELDVLKSRARVMGIQFSNNIGVDALKTKIQEKLNGEADKQAQAEQAQAEVEAEQAEAASQVDATVPAPAAPKMSAAMALRQKLLEEQTKLVRLRITNLDPKKKDLPGEIFTVGNEYIGTIKKFVPFGEVTDNGFHVPYCIYQMMKDRTFVQIRTIKGQNGRPDTIETRDVREFALEVLEPLTPKELAELAASQAAKGGLD